jgi:hypothetical protein
MMSRMKGRRVRLALLCSMLVAGCGGDGTLVVRIYGEDFVEQGVPAEAMDDGWAVTFTRFDVTLTSVSIAGDDIPAPEPLDLTADSAGRGHELGRVIVPAGTYRDARFTLARVIVEGEATRDGTNKHFAFDFDRAVTYSGCETSVRVGRGAEATFEITLHADHLFLDSRASADPGLRFQALADADLDDDGEITRADLEAADIGAYDPGSDGGHIENLWDYLEALVAEIGHANGEAHCVATPAGG